MEPSAAALLDDLLALPPPTDSSATNAAAAALDLVLEGDVDALRWLLQHDARTLNVNARSPTTGRALLHEACAEGSLEIIKFLLEKTNADIMLRTLLVPSSADVWEAVCELVASAAQRHAGVTNNHRAVVFLLLSYGADALSRDRFGSSPMHYVKSLSIAKLLVQYGGRVLDYNSKRKNALESVLVFAESGNVEDDVARREFQKFLQHQAGLEYKRKLEALRQIKKTAKAKASHVQGNGSSGKKQHQKQPAGV